MSSSLFGGKGASPSGSLPQNTSTGNFSNAIKTKNPRGMRQYQKFTPEQMQLFQQSFGNVSPESLTSKLAAGDQSGFAETEAPALRQFNELQGGLASRFSGMGSGGARNSSGFQNASNQQASNFAQQLQSNRQNLQRQALMDLRGLSSDLLGLNPYEQYMKPQQDKFDWGGALGALGGGVAGFFAGGPAGAITGAQLGNSAFGRSPTTQNRGF